MRSAGSVSAPDWGLARRIEAILRRDIARTDRDLDGMLCAGYAELRKAAGMLYRSRRADRCREYLVAVSRPGEWRRAA
jgi:hypothetical protein